MPFWNLAGRGANIERNAQRGPGEAGRGGPAGSSGGGEGAPAAAACCRGRAELSVTSQGLNRTYPLGIWPGGALITRGDAGPRSLPGPITPQGGLGGGGGAPAAAACCRGRAELSVTSRGLNQTYPLGRWPGGALITRGGAGPRSLPVPLTILAGWGGGRAACPPAGSPVLSFLPARCLVPRLRGCGTLIRLLDE